MKLEDMSEKQIIKMRKQIVLNSLYLDDYENDFIGRDAAYIFFEGYIDFLDEIAKEEDGYIEKDGDEFEFFDKYDTEENLIRWFRIAGKEEVS